MSQLRRSLVIGCGGLVLMGSLLVGGEPAGRGAAEQRVVTTADVAAGTAPAATSRSTSRSPREATTPPTPVGLSFFVLGDSYVSGTAQSHGVLFQDLISQRFHWALDWDGEGGTGYVTADPVYGPAYGGRLDKDLSRSVGKHNPTFVVVAGGANDRDLRPRRVARAAAKLYHRIEAKVRTRLVVISPWTPVRSDERPALDAALKRTALAAGAHWIDTHSWFVDHPRLIGADHDHPTVAGMHYIARRVGDVLGRIARRQGLRSR